jgi:hypothetical protein
MVYSTAERVLIGVHSARDPSDDDWRGWLERVRDAPGDKPNVFVYTAGGAPNSKQRKALFEAAGDRGFRASIVSPSRVALAIGTAISWFYRDLRTFSPAQVDRALGYLELDEHAAEAVLRAARALAQELGMVAAVTELAARGSRRAG